MMQIILKIGEPHYPCSKKSILYPVRAGRDYVVVDEAKARAYCITWNDFRAKTYRSQNYFYDYLPQSEVESWIKERELKKEKKS